MAEPQVFISYKSEELETAMWVRSVLETNDISCWMAPDNIPGGSSYAAEIPRAIRGCKVFVVIISEKSQESMWVPKELDQAINSHKIIMPFMIENCDLKDDFNFYLSNVHRYAAYENKVRAAEKMVKEIRTIVSLSEDSETESAAPSSEPTREADGKDKEKPVKAKAKPDKVKVPGKSKLKLSRRTALWAGIAALVVALCVGLGIFLHHRNGAAQPAAESDIMRITLSAPVDMSVHDFTDSIPILQERLDILAEDTAYTMDVVGDTIELSMPRSVFSGKDPAETLNRYICCPSAFCALDLETFDYLPLAIEDLESVELLNGAVEGADLHEKGLGDTYDYFRVVLKKEIVDRYGEYFREWGDNFSLAMDHDGISVKYSFVVFPGEDAQTYYMVDTKQAGNNQQVVLYNLTHSPLPGTFDVTVDLMSETAWQRGENMGGANQCEPESITDGAVCFTMTCSKLSSGELVDMYKALYARLDALGCPYAIGESGNSDERSGFAVKLPMDHASPAVMELIAASSIRVQGSNAEMDFGSYGDKLSLESLSDGAKAVRLKSNENGALIMQKIAEFAQENGDGRIYLTIEKEKLLAADASEFSEDGLLLKSYCSVEQDKMVLHPLDAAHAWIADLANAVLNGQKLPEHLTVKKQQFYPGEDGKLPTDTDFFQKREYDSSELCEEIEALYDDAEAHVTSKGNLVVLFHMPVTEELPERAAALGKQVYELADMRHSTLNGISILFIDENNDLAERCRIFFANTTKILYSIDDVSDGFVFAYGIFTGGRLAPYADAFRQIIETDAFYVSMNKLNLDPNSYDDDWTIGVA